MKRLVLFLILIMNFYLPFGLCAQQKSITLDKALSIVQGYYKNHYRIDFYWLSDRTDHWGIFADEQRDANWAHNCAMYIFPNTGDLAIDTVPEKIIPEFMLPPAETWDETPLAVQKRVHNSKYGQLSTKLENSEDVNHILVLTGKLDAADFQALLQHIAVCKRLTNVDLSEVEVPDAKIPDNALWNEELTASLPLHLPRISLPKNIESIGRRAFSNVAFEVITLPASLKSIGSRAGYDWENICWIYSKAKTPPSCENGMVFGGTTPKTTPIYVPIGSAQAYKSTPGWDYFTNFIETNKAPSAGIYGVDAVAPTECKAYWGNGCLYIESAVPTNYSVYTLKGHKVAEGETQICAAIGLPLPQAVYIVKVGNTVLKVR